MPKYSHDAGAAQELQDRAAQRRTHGCRAWHVAAPARAATCMCAGACCVLRRTAGLAAHAARIAIRLTACNATLPHTGAHHAVTSRARLRP